MQSRVDSILKTGLDDRDELRYMLNSAHDTQVANLIWWLNSIDYDFIDIPYASSVIIELRYD